MCSSRPYSKLSIVTNVILLAVFISNSIALLVFAFRRRRRPILVVLLICGAVMLAEAPSANGSEANRYFGGFSPTITDIDEAAAGYASSPPTRFCGITKASTPLRVSAAARSSATFIPLEFVLVSIPTPETASAVPYVTGYRFILNPDPWGPNASAIWSASLRLSKSDPNAKTAALCPSSDEGIVFQPDILSATSLSCSADKIRGALNRSSATWASSARASAPLNAARAWSPSVVSLVVSFRSAVNSFSCSWDCVVLSAWRRPSSIQCLMPRTASPTTPIATNAANSNTHVSVVVTEPSTAAIAASTASLVIGRPRDGFIYVFILFVISIGLVALIWPIGILRKRMSRKMILPYRNQITPTVSTLVRWPRSVQAETVTSDRASAACYRRAKNIGVMAIVVAELKFSNVERQVLLADLVIGANNAALKDAPKSFNRVGVHSA